MSVTLTYFDIESETGESISTQDNAEVIPIIGDHYHHQYISDGFTKSTSGIVVERQFTYFTDEEGDQSLSFSLTIKVTNREIYDD